MLYFFNILYSRFAYPNFYNKRTYSIVSIDFTILNLAIERKGTAVASKQTVMASTVASIIEKMGTALRSKLPICILYRSSSLSSIL